MEKPAGGSMSAHDRTGVGSGSGEWCTPPDLFDRLNRTFQFDYDAFASHENALCKQYSTPDGTYDNRGNATWGGPPEQISLLDGLTFSPGDGDPTRRFANPEYGRGFIGPAMEWLAESRGLFDITVALIPDSRDTSWWRSYVAPFAIDIPIGRVHFIHPAGDCGSRVCAERHKPGEPQRDTPGGSVLAIYFPDWRPS